MFELAFLETYNKGCFKNMQQRMLLTLLPYDRGFLQVRSIPSIGFYKKAIIYSRTNLKMLLNPRNQSIVGDYHHKIPLVLLNVRVLCHFSPQLQVQQFCIRPNIIFTKLLQQQNKDIESVGYDSLWQISSIESFRQSIPN